jgi:ssDNA-binding Zn-finger/Zn-ribbon topoisomerase 1
MSETVAWSKCQCCGGAVAVKKTRSERAFYRCDYCGVKVEHTWMKSSDAYIAAIGSKPTAPAGAPAANSRDASRKKPAAKPDAAPEPEPTEPPKKSSWFLV